VKVVGVFVRFRAPRSKPLLQVQQVKRKGPIPKKALSYGILTLSLMEMMLPTPKLITSFLIAAKYGAKPERTPSFFEDSIWKQLILET
jgi:hypothetical protein